MIKDFTSVWQWDAFRWHAANQVETCDAEIHLLKDVGLNNIEFTEDYILEDRGMQFI